MAEKINLFGIAQPEAKKKEEKILKKISSPMKTSEKHVTKVSKKLSLNDRLSLINSEVLRVLDKQKGNILCIKDINVLHEYISKAISIGRIDIDTETNNSLDPITCKLMGPCIYTPGEPQAYIPVNHRNPETKDRLEWQLTEQDVAKEFQRLINSNTFIVMHNGKFDYQVIKCTCNLELPINWDTMIAAKLLDENERSAGLKQQYIDKIDPDQEKYSIDHLFEGVEYSDVDPDIFAYYSATDALMTDKLYEWQVSKFKDPDLSKVFRVFTEVEMPLVPVLAEMELAGMEVDQDYAIRLSQKYHQKLLDLDKRIEIELSSLREKIDNWRLCEDANIHPAKKTGEGLGKSKNEQLEDPINLASPTQLAILFYDILKAPQVSKKSPRGTGEEELKAIAGKINLNICNLLLERREIVKLLSTYIDTIPELAKRWPDGRIRTHFNQYGAATGRLSSSEPLNFQNIPSHSKNIRLLFKAKEGYKILGADYSAQEPRITAFMSQDPSMIKAYEEKKDLYSVIASMSFGRSYEDCLEFYPEGTKVMIDGQEIIAGYKNIQNTEGKKYRTMAKSILLGITYGRGAASVGEQIGKTREEAQEIIDKFFNAFPAVKKWINESIEGAKTLGYVEDISGRRRRLPDAQLDKFVVSYINKNPEKALFNPLLHSAAREDLSNDPIICSYKNKLNNLKYSKDYEKIKEEAKNYNINIENNSGFIAQAERQAVNARIQGSAATLTKCALNKIFRDERLRNIGARLINTVHDEILIESPENVVEQASQYLIEDMISSAKNWVSVPMSADSYCVSHWYEDEFCASIQSQYKKLIELGSSEEDAEKELICNNQELTKDQVISALHKNYIF